MNFDPGEGPSGIMNMYTLGETPFEVIATYNVSEDGVLISQNSDMSVESLPEVGHSPRERTPSDAEAGFITPPQTDHDTQDDDDGTNQDLPQSQGTAQNYRRKRSDV